MNKFSRLGLFFFIMGMILFIGLAFSAWVVPHVVQPIAETVWLFLRVFILNIDQIYYWNMLSIVVVIWVTFRFVRKNSPIRREAVIVRNEAINNLQNWQKALVSSKHEGSQRRIAREKILQLLISHYASRKQNPNQGEIKQDLELRRLSLPDSVYNFLFLSEERRPAGLSLSDFNHAFRRWYRRIRVKDEAVFNQMLDELIEFIKT